MKDVKKDAITLACVEVRERWGTNCCSSCPVNRGKKKIDCTGYFDRDICLSLIKKYFQQQADIPDGWDVIKKWIKEESTRMEHIDERMASLVLQKLCKKYGIEVDDAEL